MEIEEALVIVAQVLDRGCLSKVEEIVFRQAWAGKSYQEIAQTSGYDAGYVKDTGYRLWQRLSEVYGQKVTKHNFRAVLKRPTPLKGKSHTSSQALLLATEHHQTNSSAEALRQDWGTAIDASIFYGRETELATLQQWIGVNNCRVVSLLGIGGMGKTALSVKIAEVMQGEFAALIWRSLRDAPPLDELLATLIQFLSPAEVVDLPDSISGRIGQLIDLLRRSRSLIVLDNFDTVLQRGQRAGTYRSGYENYGELLMGLGEIRHQSCVLLTSREKPQEVAALEGEQLPVRTLALTGLDGAAGAAILQLKGLSSSPAEMQELVTHYGGNPLALKIAATSIQDMFAGNIAEFLREGSTTFNGVGTLLAQQCDRLSALEQQVMDWIAISRKPVTPAELQADLALDLSRSHLMTVLESLRWRSLIERSTTGFTQQPVVMEFVTERLVEQISQEIVTLSPQRLYSHALMKAQTEDYIRESQIRVIVQPLMARLLVQLRSPQEIEQRLHKILDGLRQMPTGQRLYGGGNLLNLFRQLETDLTGYDFSGISIRQAYLQDVNLHQVKFIAAEFIDCAFAATFGGVTSVAVSADGQRLATSDTNGDVQLWLVADGKQLALCRGHNNWVWQVAFSPTQPLLASCGQDHTVRLWDERTGAGLKRLEGHTGIVTTLAYSPDGQWLASGGGDQTIRVWHLATGTCTHTLEGHTGCIWSLTFHPDGRRLFSAGEDNLIHLWDVTTGQRLGNWEGHHHWIRAIALSPGGDILASGSFDHTIKLWQVSTGVCVATLKGHHKTVTSVAFSPDGQTLASSSYDQTVRLWNLTTQRCLHVLHRHTHSIWAVAFHPGGRLLVSGGEDYTARLWDVETGQCAKTLQGYSNSVYSIALSAADALLASAHEDQTIKLWHLDQSTPAATREPFKVLRGHRDRVFRVLFSPDGQTLASASFDHTLKLWNPQTGACLQTLQGHKSWVWGLSFSPDGQQVASSSYDHTIRLWDTQTGHCQQVLQEHTSSVLAIAYSPDGRYLASGGYEQTIKLWDVATGSCLQTWNAHLNRVWAVAFRSDSQLLATGGDDHSIHIWDTATYAVQQTLTGHTSQVLVLAFSADGRRLISSSADRTIKVWDYHTGTCILTLAGHRNWVWSLVPIGAAAQHLLSCSQDETIRYWDLTTGRCLQVLHATRPYEGMQIQQTTGLTEAEIATLKALGAVAD